MVQGQNLLKREIRPEYKCFVDWEANSSFQIFFLKEIWLSCQQLQNCELQRQLVMKPVTVLGVFLGDCQWMTVLLPRAAYLTKYCLWSQVWLRLLFCPLLLQSVTWSPSKKGAWHTWSVDRHAYRPQGTLSLRSCWDVPELHCPALACINTEFRI